MRDVSDTARRMDRRLFLRNAALLAAGVVAVDQLELVERLTHRRRLFPAWPFVMPTLHGDGVSDDAPAIQALIGGRVVYDRRVRRILRGADAWALCGGEFALSETVVIDRPLHLPESAMISNIFRWTAAVPDSEVKTKVMLRVPSSLNGLHLASAAVLAE